MNSQSNSSQNSSKIEIAPGIFLDQLTQTKTIVPNYTNKPLPSKPRLLPPTPPTCPFCLLASQVPNPTLTDEHATRELIAYNDSAYLVSNLWGPLLNVGGDNLLLIPRSHLTSFEELNPDQLYDYISLLEESYFKFLSHPSKFIFFNVGIASGSSIAHLHAQLLSFPQKATPRHANLTSKEKVYQDYLLSFDNDLVINKFTDQPLTPNQLADTPQAYIPLIMSRSLEVRFIGGSPFDRAILIQKIINLFALNYNYNITIFPTSSFAQLLPALDYGIIYPHFFDLTIQVASSQQLANTLKESYKLSFLDPNQP